MPTVSPQARCLEPSSQPWTYSLRLPHDARAARVARATLRVVLHSHGMTGLADTAELLTSEMVTNALHYSDGPAQLRLRNMEEHHLRVSVWDSNPRIPSPFHTPPGPLTHHSALTEAADTARATHGRGLLLVRLCADNWGGYPLTDHHSGTSGKLLWFELTPHHDAFGIAA
ncbi:ATP-binding protein [Streptomyces sp. NPDC000941]